MDNELGFGVYEGLRVFGSGLRVEGLCVKGQLDMAAARSPGRFQGVCSRPTHTPFVNPEAYPRPYSCQCSSCLHPEAYPS
jgi:hypothetical protein